MYYSDKCISFILRFLLWFRLNSNILSLLDRYDTVKLDTSSKYKKKNVGNSLSLAHAEFSLSLLSLLSLSLWPCYLSGLPAGFSWRLAPDPCPPSGPGVGQDWSSHSPLGLAVGLGSLQPPLGSGFVDWPSLREQGQESVNPSTFQLLLTLQEDYFYIVMLIFFIPIKRAK